jgi:hypothetical protein
MIGVVAIKQPPIVVRNDVAESRRVGARQIGVDGLDAIDAEIGPVLQFENVAIAGEVPGLGLLRPMDRLALAQDFVMWIRVLDGRAVNRP